MQKVKLCKKCRARNVNTLWENGYYSYLYDDCYECPMNICGAELIDTNINSDEYHVIVSISEDVNFLEAMIKLKQDDIIEYQSRMSQFRAQLQQQKQEEERNTLKCPYCHSTDIAKIGGMERAASVTMFGIFSKKINKSFKCKKCGGTF